jgi:hypothetical protein
MFWFKDRGGSPWLSNDSKRSLPFGAGIDSFRPIIFMLVVHRGAFPLQHPEQGEDRLAKDRKVAGGGQ